MHRRHREVEGIARHLPEISVMSRETSQPGVLQLLRAPQLGERLPSFSERILGGAGRAVNVEQSTVGVEHTRFNARKPWSIHRNTLHLRYLQESSLTLAIDG